MTEKVAAPLINAHHRTTLPLLRRPRAPRPPPTKQKSRRNTSISSLPLLSITRTHSTQGEQSREKDASNPDPLPPLHPSPLTPHHPHTPPPLTNPRTSPLCYGGPPFFPAGDTFTTDYDYYPDPWGDSVNFLDNFGPSELPEKENPFTFNDFLLENEEANINIHLMPTKLKGCMFSRQNYQKLTSWFATHVPQQTEFNTLSLQVDHQAQPGRIPHYQALIELESLIKEAMEPFEEANDEEEEENYEPQENKVEETQTSAGEYNGAFSLAAVVGDGIIRASTTRHFCGQGRSDSPFGGPSLIPPSEVAILESMMEGGLELSLKAHFLSSLPSLSPLSVTLVHLNLSFNDITEFPPEVLALKRLVTLKMRNNPIKAIPDGIRALVKLEVLGISFNIIRELPLGLMQLPSLVELDVSHNALRELPTSIDNLRNLRKLNVVGNELIGLPPSILSLPLSHLLLANNYMHPYLWKENCRGIPQRLVDICCSTVSQYTSQHTTHLPTSHQNILLARKIISSDQKRCAVCRGAIFGSVVQFIKSVSGEQFGLKHHLPIVFTVCSHACKARHRLL